MSEFAGSQCMICARLHPKISVSQIFVYNIRAGVKVEVGLGANDLYCAIL